jgi:hypothetical protein
MRDRQPEASRTAGADFPPGCRPIDIHVQEIRQLFNSMDPSPFQERDLDPRAEEFIVSWAQEMPPKSPLGLRVFLDGVAGTPGEEALLQGAIGQYFRLRSEESVRRIRQLFRIGRASLAIGLGFLAASIGLGNLVEKMMAADTFGRILRESLLIGGWVAMWRPIEIFLYDWWPIRDRRRLYDRLAAATVRIVYEPHGGHGAS